MKAIVTGAAGFIGYHTAARLLDEGWQVVGIDNLNDYYQVDLKETRLSKLNARDGFRFAQADISDAAALNAAIGADRDVDVIVHLAAQAGVRYSIENPAAYVSANVMGQVSVFETALTLEKRPPVVYASSSSVYGANEKSRFRKAMQLIILSRSMRRLSDQASFWLSLTSTCTVCTRPVCASSRSTVHLVVPTWRLGCLRQQFSKANRSAFLTMAKCSVISRSSRTS